MNIFAKNNTGTSLFNTNAYFNNHIGKPTRICPMSEYDNDRFIKTDACTNSAIPTFTGKKTNKKEQKKIEETLKNIDGLHDPYSDVIMISQKRFKHLQGKIKRRSGAESMNNLMEGYTQHMFPSELEVFDLLKNAVRESKKNGNRTPLTYSDILQEELPDAKARLINVQFDVVQNIRDYSKKNLTKPEQKDVESYLTIIDKDICKDRFRIKNSRDLLRRLYDEIDDKSKVDEILRITEDFPNTATNPDAFIVKYADKTSEEIAELLVSPAQISIEHIKPSSTRGESKGANYLAASKRMNNYRSSTPLDEVIRRYPKIPMQTQRYFNELIAKINRGGLSDIALILPDVKDSLYTESKGLINVDITGIKSEIAEKTEDHKSKLQKLIEHFSTNM